MPYSYLLPPSAEFVWVQVACMLLFLMASSATATCKICKAEPLQKTSLSGQRAFASSLPLEGKRQLQGVDSLQLTLAQSEVHSGIFTLPGARFTDVVCGLLSASEAGTHGLILMLLKRILQAQASTKLQRGPLAALQTCARKSCPSRRDGPRLASKLAAPHA